MEALCKRLREDTQKLKAEKTTLEGMIQSCDELTMERWQKSMDSTAWERTVMMRMMMTKGTS
jgi:hypothetical protein